MRRVAVAAAVAAALVATAAAHDGGRYHAARRAAALLPPGVARVETDGEAAGPGVVAREVPLAARRLAAAARNNKNGARRAQTTPGGTDTSTLRVTDGAGASTLYPHTNALFGIPAYSSSVSAVLFYPTGGAALGCAGLDAAGVPAGSVVLLDRGNCSFTTKVLNAQRAGAIGAVVVDNVGVCGVDASCPSVAAACQYCPYFPWQPAVCECGLVAMGGSGDADLVRIPSFLVGLRDGGLIKASLAAGPMRVSMVWDIPNAAGQVEVEVWGHADDAQALALRQALEPFVDYFGTAVAFAPHFFVWYGPDSGCGVVGSCGNQCVNAQTYCSLDPDGDFNAGASGADVVWETVRQLCLLSALNATTGSLRPWWNYADAIVMNCNTTFDQTCSEAQMTRLGLGSLIPSVRSCFTAANAPAPLNTLLQREVDLRANMAIYLLPTVVVNDIILSGSMVTSNIVPAICNGFGARPKPNVCACATSPPEQLAACMNAAYPNGAGGGGDGGSGLPAWGGGLIALVVVAISAGVCLVWYINRRHRRQMQTLLDDYRSLVDAGDAEQAEVAGGRGRAAGGDSERARLASRLHQLTATVATKPVVPAGADAATGAPPSAAHDTSGLL